MNEDRYEILEQRVLAATRTCAKHVSCLTILSPHNQLGGYGLILVTENLGHKEVKLHAQNYTAIR